MNKPTCSHHKSDGTHCRAAAIPGRPFCFVHDPAQAEAQAAGRRKGGAAPRRRIRRYPGRLRKSDVAEILSEILIDALNNPQAMPEDRLRALTRIAEVLLREPGAQAALSSDSRHCPPSAPGQLLRIYAPSSQPGHTPRASERATPSRGPETSPATLPAEQHPDSTGTGPSRTTDPSPLLPQHSARSTSPATETSATKPSEARQSDARTPTETPLPSPTALAASLAIQHANSTWTPTVRANGQERQN